MYFKENKIISNNMTLPKFERCVTYRTSKIHLKRQKHARPKKGWSEKIIVNCDVICGADKKRCGLPVASPQKYRDAGNYGKGYWNYGN